MMHEKPKLGFVPLPRALGRFVNFPSTKRRDRGGRRKEMIFSSAAYKALEERIARHEDWCERREALWDTRREEERRYSDAARDKLGAKIEGSSEALRALVEGNTKSQNKLFLSISGTIILLLLTGGGTLVYAVVTMLSHGGKLGGG